jgi:hypothetical protein
VTVSHDSTELGLEESLAAGQIGLPEGVTIRLPATQTVAAIVTEKVRKDEETPAAGAAPGAAPAAGAAAAAPAAAEKKADKKDKK